MGNSNSETESSDDESGAETDHEGQGYSKGMESTSEKPSKPEGNNQEEEIAHEDEDPAERCVFSDNAFYETSTEDAETPSDESEGDSDGSGYEKAYFISSAANIRRRELHGQNRYKEEPKEETKKEKLKAMKEAGSKATLKELQKEVQNSVARDDRGTVPDC